MGWQAWVNIQEQGDRAWRPFPRSTNSGVNDLKQASEARIALPLCMSYSPDLARPCLESSGTTTRPSAVAPK